MSSLVENNVKPRVFFDTFPNRVIYVRDLPAGGGWRDVFLADTSRPGETTVYFAREGRILVDREKKLVQLQLMHGTQHTTLAAQPDEYQGTEFESISLNLDPQTVFPPPPSKGAPEMTIADLRRTIAEAAKRGDTIPGYNSRFMIQYKFSFPVACCVLALIGLALGVSNRKDGKLASFVIGFIVIFVYYVLLYMARAAAIGGVLEPRYRAVDSAGRAWRGGRRAAALARALDRSADPDHAARPARLCRVSWRLGPHRPAERPAVPDSATGQSGLRRARSALQPALAQHSGRLHVAAIPARCSS